MMCKNERTMKTATQGTNTKLVIHFPAFTMSMSDWPSMQQM